ncbi:glycine-rich domain-containing protein [Streptomyces sp. NPDC020983]|uniref:glycine-rich domain-containing protein n=1 Tax=Streptomyces sp. NPDC020983 TaxID=3365106 RepID=UPI0037AD9A63
MLVAEPSALLPAADHAAVTATVMDNNPGMTEDTAGRILDQALAFVATAARNPLVPIAPSRTVDEGWHALVLHTAVYARLCDRLGAFVHHYPERPDTARQGHDVIERTVALLAAEGYAPDPDLWMPPSDTSVPVAASCGHSPRCGPIEPSDVVLAGAA